MPKEHNVSQYLETYLGRNQALQPRCLDRRVGASARICALTGDSLERPLTRPRVPGYLLSSKLPEPAEVSFYDAPHDCKLFPAVKSTVTSLS